VIELSFPTLYNLQYKNLFNLFYFLATTAATPSPVSSRVTSDSAKSTPPPSKHMAEVVKAAVAASKSRGRAYSIVFIMCNLCPF
jgi:hypothetical protein